MKKEFIKNRKEKKYGKNCSKCKLDFSLTKGYPQISKDTGKYICHNCTMKEYDKRPDSTKNIIKSMAKCRTRNINPNSPEGKGFLFEELTCRWRSTISNISVENLNKKLDNYRTPIDHSPDPELGIL